MFDSLRDINNRQVMAHYKERVQPVIKETSIVFDGIFTLESEDLNRLGKTNKYTGPYLSVIKDVFDGLKLKRGSLITIREKDYKFINSQLMDDGNYDLTLQEN